MMDIIKLLGKIDDYYRDISVHEKLPAKCVLRCGAIADYLLWGTSFSEYFGYRFWTRTWADKRTYMTRRHMFKFYDQYCDKDYRARIGDKSLTKHYYGHFMDRHQFDYNDGYEAFAAFCKCHPYIFIKKKVGWGGENARYEHVCNDNQCCEVWASLDESYLVEERLQNCSEIREIYPHSLNTIKVTTLIVNGKPEIQFAIIRFGNNTPVDNVHLGGIYALVDIETGRVKTKAQDRHFAEYAVHPVTKRQIAGFQIPRWEEVKKMALEAAAITPQLRYSSWDLAVTDRGVILIEGNWDAEFYAEQVICDRGHRTMMIDKLEKGL